MADIDITLIDNSGEIMKEMERKTAAALEAIGMQAETYAKLKAPYDNGTLRNSITHTVKGDDVYIGTNISYAVYQELGTGIYATDGKGRKSPWAYQDSKGVWHNTRGVKPKHYLRDAASRHTDEYKEIITNILKGE